VATVIDRVLANPWVAEVIVVDDGSTDESVARVRSVADPRVRLVTNDGPRGAGAARNAGMVCASHRYLAFQDSDVRWHPRKMELQMQVLTDPANPSLVAVGCNWRLMQQAGGNGAVGWGDPTTAYRSHERIAVMSGRLTGEIGTPMLLIDRERARSTPRFDTDFPSLEERDFLYQCLPDNGSPLAVLDAVLVEVRRNRHDHVANPAGSLAGYERFLTKYPDELARHPEIADWYHYRAMREALILGRRSLAADHLHKIRNTSALLRVEHALGAMLGYTGLAVATRLRLKPRFAHATP